jgi:hypothetical protein
MTKPSSLSSDLTFPGLNMEGATHQGEGTSVGAGLPWAPKKLAKPKLEGLLPT